jgi:ribosomal RNA assembly protein
MEKIPSEKIIRIIKNKKNLEEKLNIRISINGKIVEIKGTPEDEYIAVMVIDALNFGFPFKDAISIKEQEKVLEIVNIKEYTIRKTNLERIRARIIGKKGKALKTLSDLTNCSLELKENKVGIIGEPENITSAIEGVIEIVQGSRHGNVYKGIEKNRPEPVDDLGLKK